MKPILEIRNISKKFNIGHIRQPYVSLRDSISSVFNGGESVKEDFWALDDVSFDVYQGEAIGVIGKNGAGKSTLLKILSKITPPTKGKIISRGRIASLLEVGTGFHPELTGRENIFLNGSILGMKRTEIQRKFDEIIAFSEVEKFLDTALKHYSSGMQLRLAFAVAAFLEPEILVIDEVLAVGDAEFQKKCLGKMGEIAKSGRTVLFVSHSMAAVQKLCTKGVLLNKGKVVVNDSIEPVIESYLQINHINQAVFDIPKTGISSEYGYAYRLQIEDEAGNLLETVPIGKALRIRVFFSVKLPMKHFIIAIGITSIMGVNLRTVYSRPMEIVEGEYEAVFYEKIFYSHGQYSLTIGLSNYERPIQYIENVASINISEKMAITDERIVKISGAGYILNPIDIEVRKL